ncbi:nucleotidyltransferase domain-containing protein [Paraburkholderia sp. UYCP14C]|uniref:nucleotidyltransferase domain-containing protein n=1 Tax=Paraburkholderia sp. UYCP14C TaxID=2511130 RepID=UPI00102089E1|nr:nucleotidyltransferase domain-containing protein [Paraburkholderia sp. UYCP14C]RZF25618.1 nucleotidyltransferase domain-containing protein [Paraburkholderia sp. UYCP14C]
MLMTDPMLADLWQKARAALGAQFEQRAPSAVFLEGSIAEGFGNERSDVDFVAIVDNGLEPATMPYILFIDGRRIEVRLLSPVRLRRELAQVRAALGKGRRAVARLSWNLLERCQRFIGALPIDNPALIETLQAELGREALCEAVALWFEDFARQTGRYAVAMFALGEPDYARAWIRTAAFHAAKSHVARLGECYMSPKWLSLQLERASVDANLVGRLWNLLHASREQGAESALLAAGVALLREFGVSGVNLVADNVLIGPGKDTTTWQIGERVHVLRGNDVFALDNEAAQVWRAITFDTSCTAIASRGDAQAAGRQLALIADFSRLGLVSLRWKGGGEIHARQQATSTPVSRAPLISIDGARLAAGRESGAQLLPMPAGRFAEAGLEMVWANIGLENAREDAQGALQRGQWKVLEYALQRMMQTACMVTLGAHGVTPQSTMEEATLDAIRLLPLDAALIDGIRELEQCAIGTASDAQRYVALADELAQRLRNLGGDPQFPASFDTASGWRGTIHAAYDWINLGAHLHARFPQTAHGGRGTAEEARDLLASSST